MNHITSDVGRVGINVPERKSRGICRGLKQILDPFQIRAGPRKSGRESEIGAVYLKSGVQPIHFRIYPIISGTTYSSSLANPQRALEIASFGAKSCA